MLDIRETLVISVRRMKKQRFMQSVDLLTAKNEKAVLARAKKVTMKKRGFGEYVRGLINADFNKATSR